MRPLVLVMLGGALGGTLAASACGGSSTPPAADSATVARAQGAAQALAPELARLLMTEMNRAGPLKAIEVCADSAQARTERHSVNGLRVRRIGTRIRNPLNAPDTLEQRMLAYLEEQKLAGSMPDELMEVARTGPDETWELRYLRPITTLQFCTTCHGDASAMPSDVRALIAERYPDDKAVGYAIGDLRGAVSVRVPLPVND